MPFPVVDAGRFVRLCTVLDGSNATAFICQSQLDELGPIRFRQALLALLCSRVIAVTRELVPRTYGQIAGAHCWSANPT
jgi:hypothetical protein